MGKFTIESFNNTEIAFRSKSNWKLKKALWLFSIVKNPGISKIMTTLAELFPIKPVIKSTVFDHFCGGETIAESEETIQELHSGGVQTILDYSVEGAQDEAAFDFTTREIMATIENAARHSEIPFAVFKVSGIAPVGILEKSQSGQELTSEEQIAFDKCIGRIDTLCETASNNRVPVFIDAEDSWYQDIIDQTAYKNMARFNGEEPIVFNTFQMYRKDSLERLQVAISNARKNNYHFGAKLVRGAYMEIERERAVKIGYEDPICSSKEATDKLYNSGVKLCVDNIDNVALANCSHNEESNLLLTSLMEEKGIDRSDKRLFFAQLYGMSDNISFNLADAGYNVGKYVPYGPVKKVMPYLIRRATENTSVAGQSTRELALIQAEVKRRKAK